jgi:hypothetical protein
MDNAFDEAEESTDDKSSDFDVQDYYEQVDSGESPKDKTIGVATSEELHAFYRELRDSEDVDVDVTESIREHLRNLAHRHEEVFEKSMRKLEIEREY